MSHEQVLAKIASGNVTGASVSYSTNGVEISGRARVLLFSIPFRLFGRFYRSGNVVGLSVDRLAIRGSPASEDRRRAAAAKLARVIRSKADRIVIEQGGHDVYSQDL